jgi:diguanylate cyclase (GGDEF)-like protein/PAS domain S-box-containing protein
MATRFLPESEPLAASKRTFRPWVETAETLAVGTAVGFAAWASLAMNGPLNLAIFWPANGVLLGFLLISRLRRWPSFLAAGFAASLLVHLAYRFELRGSLIMSAANIVEILLAAWPFVITKETPPDLTRPRTLLRFLLVSLTAPFFSGLLAIGMLGAFLPNNSLAMIFRGWYAGDALGLIVALPVMLAVLRRESLDLFRPRRLPETLLMFAALLVPALLLTNPQRFPLMFIDFALLVLVVFRLGLPAATIGVVLISIPITRFAATGTGIFSMHFYGTDTRVLILQAYFFVQLMMVYLISAVLGERRRLEAALRGSEERYRSMAEHSWDIIVRTSPSGVREYVSPSVMETTGWRAEELIGSDFRREVHPDDSDQVDSLLGHLGDAEDKQALHFRMRCRSGEYLWFEARGRAVKDPVTGEAKEFIAVMRDVSARVARDEAMKDAYVLAESRALTDALTGLGNRRSFDEMLDVLWKQSCDEQIPLSLLMIDADRFKDYNDSYGHQAGDACLCQIAEIIACCVREKTDFAARYGGEEFSVILPGASAEECQAVAERIRATVASCELEPQSDPGRRISVSIGAATAEPLNCDWTNRDLLHAADAALYDAKRSGRNCVRTSGEESDALEYGLELEA